MNEQQADNSFVLTVPISIDAPVTFLVASKDTGGFVWALVTQLPPGKNIEAYSFEISYGELLRLWGRINGVEAKAKEVSLEEYEATYSYIGIEVGEVLRKTQEYGYTNGAIKPPDVSTLLLLSSMPRSRVRLWTQRISLWDGGSQRRFSIFLAGLMSYVTLTQCPSWESMYQLPESKISFGAQIGLLYCWESSRGSRLYFSSFCRPWFGGVEYFKRYFCCSLLLFGQLLRSVCFVAPVSKYKTRITPVSNIKIKMTLPVMRLSLLGLPFA